MIEAGGLLCLFLADKTALKRGGLCSLTLRSSAFSQMEEALRSLSKLNPKCLQYEIISCQCTLWIPSIPKLLFWISSNFLCKKLTPSSIGCLVIKYDFQFWLNNNEPVDGNHTNTHTYMLLYKAPPPKKKTVTESGFNFPSFLNSRRTNPFYSWGNKELKAWPRSKKHQDFRGRIQAHICSNISI